MMSAAWSDIIQDVHEFRKSRNPDRFARVHQKQVHYITSLTLSLTSLLSCTPTLIVRISLPTLKNIYKLKLLTCYRRHISRLHEWQNIAIPLEWDSGFHHVCRLVCTGGTSIADMARKSLSDCRKAPTTYRSADLGLILRVRRTSQLRLGV
jgi:hypothetical protein